MMHGKIRKLSEQDKLALMRKEIKFKKLVFSELPAEFVLFKQYNIYAEKMFQNLLALHAVDPANQDSISVEDIYDVTDALASHPCFDVTKPSRKSKQTEAQPASQPMEDLEWPPSEEEFIVALEEDGWQVCSVIAHDEASNTIKAHLLEPIKTRAKDDFGKTYWIYSEEENVDSFEEKHILSVRQSLNLAKNIKRKDPVFAPVNHEVIEGITSSLYHLPFGILLYFCVFTF